MQKHINIQLYKNLLLSDFGFVQTIKNLSLYQVKSSNLSFCYLNLFECIKSIKLLSRGFLFLNTQKKNCVILKISNMQHYALLKQFVRKRLLTYKILIKKDKEDTNSLSFDFTQFFFFLNSNSCKKYNVNFYRHLLMKKIFLIMRVNLNIEFNSCGFYKFYSDIGDFKKIIFLLLLINQLYLKNKN